MSCYLRHLEEALKELNIEVTPQNKKQIDQAIHQIVGVQYKDCPAAWKRVKGRIAATEQERQAFIKQLQALLE